MSDPYDRPPGEPYWNQPPPASPPPGYPPAYPGSPAGYPPAYPGSPAGYPPAGSPPPGYPPAGSPPGYPPAYPGSPAGYPPEYTRADYARAEYPPSGMPTAGYPPTAPPPPPRSRATLILVLVGVAVLLIAGTATAIFVLRGDKKPASTAGSTPTPTLGATTSAPTTSAPSPTPPASTVTFAAPDRIGTLRKMADQSRVAQLPGQMAAGGLGNTFAVIYEDSTAKGHTAIVWGGTSSFLGGADAAVLDGFFSSAGNQIPNGKLAPRTTVDPGSVGGTAQCAKVDGVGVPMALCGWTGSGALAGLLFTGFTADKSAGLVRQVLPAIVVKS